MESIGLNVKKLNKHLRKCLRQINERSVYMNRVNEFQDFLNLLIIDSKPYMLFTPGGIDELTRTLFGNDVYMDFILQLKTAFFGGFIFTKEDIEDMNNLILSAIVEGDVEYHLLPNDISTRLSKNEDDNITKVLEANIWLYPYLFTSFWVKPSFMITLYNDNKVLAEEMMKVYAATLPPEGRDE